MTKEKLKINLPYAGAPLICAALLMINPGGMDVIQLLRYELILVFGYIAAVLDARSNRIPNNLVIAMMAAWVIMMLPLLFLDTEAALTRLTDSGIGLATGGGLFFVLYLVSRKGLGGGDVKFIAAAGLYLGFKGILPVMLYGTILASLTGIVLIALKKIGRKDKIPLAPFLNAGILITVFFQ